MADKDKKDEKPDINSIGKAFVEHYYNLFDTNRIALTDLWQDSSMLTFEKEQYQGREKIMRKLLNGVKFRTIQHIPKTLDVQPSGANGLMIMTTGELKVDSEVNALKYGETFHLLPTDKSFQKFWVHNCIFRLNYA